MASAPPGVDGAGGNGPGRRLFGTDGVRGLANGDLTPELALALASAAVRTLADGVGRPLVVVGRDPRPSGEFLEAAVVAGLAASGADVLRLGVLPTPAVAHAVAVGLPDAGVPLLGVMISASHNPMPDNGIKFFGPGGYKLPDEIEDALAASLTTSGPRPTGAAVGRVRDSAGHDWYDDHLLAALHRPLEGLRVVVDCASGAASTVAPGVLRRAGATVIALHDDPARSGGVSELINEGRGATALDVLRAAVGEHRADAGVAFDGDADRCLAVDATGEVVDGDQILAIHGVALKERGALAGGALVTTVMTNLGFHRAMQAHGIEVVTTAVGDRYVLEAMTAGGYRLGGEQSGHTVFAEHATTGDGVLTALLLLERMAATGQTLAELAAVMTRMPQVLVNCRVADRAVADTPRVRAAVQAVHAELAGRGRVLVRASGTEPLIRVMVEAERAEQAHQLAERIAAAVRD